QTIAVRDGTARPGDTYISPRTKAASRDALNASALLHHRWTVTKDDLHALRFVLTTISGNDRSAMAPTEEVFNEALHSTLQSYSDSDLETVRELTTIAQTFSWFTQGTPLESQHSHGRLVRVFLSLIGKTSWHDVTYDTFTDALKSRQIPNPRVNALREEILEEIQEHTADVQ
ncbi:MAG TPA: hypothetical protein VFK32_01990, partial [Tepidiformaceae bacterium]|nr:hypothetical protein [Tepidiformaceae bacterium]